MAIHSLAKNIKRLLDARGMKPIELAREAQIDRSQLSRILKGKSVPSIESLARIASALEVSAGYLLDGEVRQVDHIAELQAKPDLQIALRSIQKLDDPDQERVLSIISQVVSMIDRAEESAH